MKIQWPWTRNKVQKELNNMEAMLESLFTPVPPRPGYLEDLRLKLVGQPGPLAAAGASTLKLILMIIGGIVGLVLFIFGAIRAVISLITGFRLIGNKVQTRRQEKGASTKRKKSSLSK